MGNFSQTTDKNHWKLNILGKTRLYQNPQVFVCRVVEYNIQSFAAKQIPFKYIPEYVKYYNKAKDRFLTFGIKIDLKFMRTVNYI